MSISNHLHEQQQAFSAAVLARDPQALPLQALFVGPPAHIMRRLAIYRANLQAARVSALSAAFGTVEKIVGADFFQGLAREYGRAHPSSQGDLHGFGTHFAHFLEGFEPIKELPYLPDVARLDWALHCADAAADAPALTAPSLLQALGAQAANSVRVKLHPAAALIASRFPLWDIWLFNHADSAQTPGDIAALDWEQAQAVLVSRSQWRAVPRLASAAETAALTALQNGESLEAALSAALQKAPQLDMAAQLAAWCNDGILLHVYS
jgi:uncharacterized protein